MKKYYTIVTFIVVIASVYGLSQFIFQPIGGTYDSVDPVQACDSAVKAQCAAITDTEKPINITTPSVCLSENGSLLEKTKDMDIKTENYDLNNNKTTCYT